ncbi:hypothetical protein J5N97_013878 [Dioscorea zingiberensis]|uniref:Uncharacterized protein n=1 Tax=Dioscorea zingiberensis TaxID=325984 RepID=A0A9D5CT31_9LILI|nr:hypothetical protein J5N97_013878 [Dioscorea zingiberensis]
MFVPGMVKVDMESWEVKRFEYGRKRYNGEPMFVPTMGGKEDEGHVMSLVHDEEGGVTELVVFKADELEQVSEVRLPTRVPYGVHGTFCFLVCMNVTPSASSPPPSPVPVHSPSLSLIRSVLRSGYLPHVKIWSSAVARLASSPDDGPTTDLHLFDSILRRLRRLPSPISSDARPDPAAFNAALNDVPKSLHLFEELEFFYNILIIF